jgi:hypothetical protein
VTISGDNSNGAGYLPGETVQVNVSGPNEYTAQCEAIVGPEGTWSCQITLWSDERAIGEYSYVAHGVQSGTSESGTFTDTVNVRLAATGLPAGTSVSVPWSGTNNGGNPVSGTATFTPPATALLGGFQDNSTLNCTFPASINAAGNLYNLSSTPCPLTTGPGGPPTPTRTFTATYVLAPPSNTQPSITNLTGPSPVDEHAITERTYTFSFTDPDANTWSFVSGYPTCGTGGSLVSGSASINQSAKTGEFKCIFDDGPATPTVTAKIFDGTVESLEAPFDVIVNNVAPTATLGNSGPVGEGTAATISFSSPSDPSGADTSAGFKYSFSCSNNAAALAATYAAATNTTGSTPCTFGDNGLFTVVARILDKNDGYTDHTTEVTVNNVAPSKTTDSFFLNPYTGAAAASVGFSDPGWLDVVTATFSAPWPSPASQGPGAGPAALTGTFSSDYTYGPGCITDAISVRVQDDDGDYFDHEFAAADTLGVHTVSFKAPIREGTRNIAKLGNVIPVKLEVLDCHGNPVTGLTLSIRLRNGDSTDETEVGATVVDATSVSSADAGNIMRYQAVDGFYMYNLATRGLATGVPFTIIIRDGDLLVASALIELKK